MWYIHVMRKTSYTRHSLPEPARHLDPNSQRPRCFLEHESLVLWFTFSLGILSKPDAGLSLRILAGNVSHDDVIFVIPYNKKNHFQASCTFKRPPRLLYKFPANTHQSVVVTIGRRHPVPFIFRQSYRSKASHHRRRSLPPNLSDIACLLVIPYNQQRHCL